MDYSIQEFDFEGERSIRLAPGLNYGLLLTVRGSALLFSGEESWSLSTEELMVCKPGTSSVLKCTDGQPMELFWLMLSTNLMEKLSTEKTNVLTGFSIAPYRVAVVRPGSKTLMLMKNLLRQLKGIDPETDGYCADLLEDSTLKMFVAMVLRSCASQDSFVKRRSSTFTLDEVFSYIHAHLCEEMQLERLEKEFFVSRSFLTKEFKRRTGQTVHRYIVKARLDICRRMLEKGYSAKEIYSSVGFCSYNHLFKAFKKEYGMTPGEYLKSFSNDNK